jgi:hypothetical protein
MSTYVEALPKEKTYMIVCVLIRSYQAFGWMTKPLYLYPVLSSALNIIHGCSCQN